MPDLTVTLPSLGEDAENAAKVSFVYPEVGDTVEEGEDLVEMVTDKATFNVPAPQGGSVAKILVEEDQEIAVGDPLVILTIS
jgi:pyruvate/2-oxoglutarate dehydrogenase complex dihydrolipoamide acyltransferase (E2) component